jgi:hypothetical protein
MSKIQFRKLLGISICKLLGHKREYPMCAPPRQRIKLISHCTRCYKNLEGTK